MEPIEVKIKYNNPKTSGFFLCKRKGSIKPELVEIRRQSDGTLTYMGAMSMFSLNMLEKTAKFSRKLELEGLND